MDYYRVVCFPAFLFCTLGCSPEPELERDVRDPEVYAGHVKSRIVNYLEEVRRKPRQGKERVGFLIDMLEDYPKAPVGENRDLYQQLLESCRELHEMYGGGDAKQTTQEKIEEIVELSKQLPGLLELGSHQ